MSMHWAGEYGGESQVNAVVSRIADPSSGQPAFKSQPVELFPVKAQTYGLYLGERFVEHDFIYQSFQSEERVGVWRFADSQRYDKSFATELGETPHKRKVVLELAGGWLTVCYDEVGEDKIIRSLLMISQLPIEVDVPNLAGLIGKPLTFSALLSVSSQQEASELICSCFRVSDKQILRELESGACTSVNQLKTKLKCGTNCGSCLPQVERFVASHEQTILIAK